MNLAPPQQNNSDHFKAAPPPILEWEGQQEWQKPRFEVRYFHRRRVELWSGYVQTGSIKGWVGNVRIQLFVDKWKREHGGHEPVNEDILDWMVRDLNILSDKSSEFELGPLADSIVNNGVRQPIIVKSDGTLLDGNRRYFAALLRFREAEQAHDALTLAMVRQLPAYVLSPVAEKDDIDAVLVQENFVDHFRKPWPSYIRALKVYESYSEMRSAGLSPGESKSRLVDIYGIKKAHVERFVRMMELIEEFQDYHMTGDEDTGRVSRDEAEVRWKAQRYFEYFDELTKAKVLKVLETDTDMREKTFDHLYSDGFESYTEIRKLPEVAYDKRAREKYFQSSGRPSVEDALSWVTITGAARRAMSANDRIASFKDWVLTLGVAEVLNLDPKAVEDLETVVTTVTEWAKQAKKGSRG